MNKVMCYWGLGVRPILGREREGGLDGCIDPHITGIDMGLVWD